MAGEESDATADKCMNTEFQRYYLHISQQVRWDGVAKIF
jgi:hypothetical protein